MAVARVPVELSRGPFRGSVAIRRGLITRGELNSQVWRRLFRDVFVWTGLTDTVALRAQAAALLLPLGAILSGFTAAWLLGAQIDPGDFVEATVHPDRAREADPD